MQVVHVAASVAPELISLNVRTQLCLVQPLRERHLQRWRKFQLDKAHRMFGLQSQIEQIESVKINIHLRNS